MIRGEMAEILLDNILRLFSTETFGKDKSAYYVGGEKKLMYIGGGIEATRSDIAWSYIIFFVVVVLLVTRFIYEDKKQNKNSL